MEYDIKEMIMKFKNGVLFLNEIENLDLNFLCIDDLRRLDSYAYQLQIPITGFDLDLYKNDGDMQMFIFETWQREAQIAEEVREKVLENYLEEYV